jgi:hypothetical protein
MILLVKITANGLSLRLIVKDYLIWFYLAAVRKKLTRNGTKGCSAAKGIIPVIAWHYLALK